MNILLKIRRLILDEIENFRKNIILQDLQSKAIFYGGNHHISLSSRISLIDGAKKENVIIEDGCWPMGHIKVSHRGQFIMHEHSRIAPSSEIQCVNKIEIGAYTTMAGNTIITDNNSHPINPEWRRKMRLTPEGHDMRTWKYSDNAPIFIGENVWIGINVRICKGVTIGDNSVIGANSVVTKSIPANCIAVGNPARVIKTDIDKTPYPKEYHESN